MTDYRDRLPDDKTRAEFDAAVLRAGRLLAAAYQELHERAAQEEAQAA